MAAKTLEKAPELEELDSLTVAVTPKKPSYTGPVVSVFLPKLEEGGEGDLKVDQYEHVTIANEKEEMHYKVHRGEHVDVPVPVFMVLKEKYPWL